MGALESSNWWPQWDRAQCLCRLLLTANTITSRTARPRVSRDPVKSAASGRMLMLELSSKENRKHDLEKPPLTHFQSMNHYYKCLFYKRFSKSQANISIKPEKRRKINVKALERIILLIFELAWK